MHWWQKATSSWGPSPGSTATVDFSTLLAIRPSLSVVVRNCAHAARQAAHWRHHDGHRSGAVGRGMGHRPVLLSVRARMNCLVWWTVLARPRGQHLGRAMLAGWPPGCRPLRRRIKRDQLAGVLVTPGGGGEVNAAGRFPGLEWRVQRSCATSADTSATVAVPATVVVAANARSRPSPRLRSLPGTSAAALEATRCRSTRGFPARGRRAKKAGALPWTTAAPSTTLFWLASAAPRFDDDVGSGEAAVGGVALGYPAPLPAPTTRFAEASWSAGVPTSVAGSWSAAEPATSMRVSA